MKLPIKLYPGRLTDSPLLLGLTILCAIAVVVTQGTSHGFFSGLGTLLNLAFGGVLMLVAIHREWLVIATDDPTETDEIKEDTP